MKLLIVDDEPVNVALLESILTAHGYTRVRSTTDARTALALFESYGPDLVLLDLTMPHIDGFAILETLRASARDNLVPVIVLTADCTDATKWRALRAGATDYLLKPFDNTEVVLRIRNLLQLRHLHLQLDNQRAAYEEAVRMRSEELRVVRAQLAQLEQVATP